MKIAFTTKGTNWDASIDVRFGRSEYFLIYDENEQVLTHLDNRDSGNDAHGAGPKTAQKIFNLNPDVLITGNGPGGNASKVMTKAGIRIYIGAGNMTAKEAYEAYKKALLKSF